jgi:hypothetical protein
MVSLTNVTDPCGGCYAACAGCYSERYNIAVDVCDRHPRELLLSMSVLYGDEGIRHRVTDSQPKVLLTN